ncbi:quinone-dependent dihydroorotate dehydrogenase [Shewanella sp. 1_MG-2023]|uniref:Dihydroorotate dehydrogenase (quinone) n=1 Tax=Shewanella electrodiphila TaxID=934143 RepID=A0ABT0KMU2_9GAMM|nr:MULTISPECIES: quinone-dependent dihydroorotate dehydrogenase [Shewanella]MCL1045165.1 quinone-dependent dihydroorotate dehydrogenase [Shewanella electrodiphila]MDO6611807.1 quinone-dependent dihydroorotate dehydrogenase [Shewanella sp. 7_MG-2023]MDO6771662.1 quinone-dependent dihydroorotate dehydrogenase [Shewanella sp. 2_MG-2023]MDO6793888.1 quinone-dependent dihydroorotate dehydrogenase [Shewanella sp. 1_MG-2023]PMG75655.1 dihydroorotate dehydrogenase (quinone) [Shewanella sp. 10N.286.51.
MFFYKVAQKVMFQMDPEVAHNIAIGSLKNTGNNPLNLFYSQNVSAAPVTCMGITFNNPVGLAAGLDKDGESIDAFHAMGFGHVEVGTVTPRPQPGNEQPRLFRLKPAKAIINRMGFNNKGVDNLVRNLMAKKTDIIVGVNIGKNKDTPVEEGKNDYLICMEKVYQHADYIAVNISSPNTPGLRTMQYGELLDDLLSSLKEKQAELAKKYNKYVPVALKIAPDLTTEEIEKIAESLLKSKFDGAIATNTTLSRDAVVGLDNADEMGGLSGKPLTDLSTKVIKQLAEYLNGEIPIIGVGGINSAEDALAKFDAGSQLVQIYTGFIYQGPGLINDIVKAYKAK